MKDERELIGKALDQFSFHCPRFNDEGKPVSLLERVEALVETMEDQSGRTFLTYVELKDMLKPLGVEPKHDDTLEAIRQMIRELLKLLQSWNCKNGEPEER